MTVEYSRQKDVKSNIKYEVLIIRTILISCLSMTIRLTLPCVRVHREDN